MSPVLTQMDRDAVRPSELSKCRRRHGVRLDPAAGLPDRRNVVDVDSEVRHLPPLPDVLRDQVRYFPGPTVDPAVVLAFEHHPQKRLGSRVADEDPPRLSQLRFDESDPRIDLRYLPYVLLFGDPDVDEDLREWRHHTCKLREPLLAPPH